ncbi:uncharacterized protein LOC129718184 isoform X1 [Wyeomyia smithii]|uniref:uncharacterized protein LOC129718184 isoform X1 n=1 Tax=Wyeomyia smithii TaxID=174621 RepID=UPI002467E7A0|nr:uncharacterized protein LOC129718184 isoform X1 [Wyeomyia smithii]
MKSSESKRIFHSTGEIVVTKAVNITLGDILDYIGDSIRPLREGQSVFESGHVVCIGYTNESDSMIDICGFVLQSSHPGDVPHEVKLHIGYDFRHWILRCVCKAGTARCKHIVACLLHLANTRFVEYLTCTSSRQAWGISKSEKTDLWKAKVVRNLCCARKHSQLAVIDLGNMRELLKQGFDRIMDASPDSAVKKHITGREQTCNRFPIGPLQTNNLDKFLTNYELRDLIQISFQHPTHSIDIKFVSDDHKMFYKKHIVKTLSEIVGICIHTKLQDNSSWRLHRSIRITGSSCYQLYTYYKNKNADWTKKIQLYLCPKSLHTKAIQYGKQVEQLALDCYMRKRNPLIKRCGFVISFIEPWIGVSPDGVDPMNGVLLEIKCPLLGADHNIEWVMNECKTTKTYLRRTNSGLQLNRNHKYFAQVQLAMYVLKL